MAGHLGVQSTKDNEHTQALRHTLPPETQTSKRTLLGSHIFPTVRDDDFLLRLALFCSLRLQKDRFKKIINYLSKCSIFTKSSLIVLTSYNFNLQYDKLLSIELKGIDQVFKVGCMTYLSTVPQSVYDLRWCVPSLEKQIGLLAQKLSNVQLWIGSAANRIAT